MADKKTKKKNISEQRRLKQIARERQVRKQRLILSASILVLVCIILLIIGIKSCANNNLQKNDKQPKEDQKETSLSPEAENVPSSAKETPSPSAQVLLPEPPVCEEAAKDPENSIHFLCVGDNLIHENIYKSGISPSGKWNYDHLYSHMKDYISSADLAMVNQECIFVQDHEDVSGYPHFGAPTEVGDSVVDAGFDIVAYANNHVWDKGNDAVMQTLDYWKKSHPETTVLGIHSCQEDSDAVQTIECKGLTISLLNFTGYINDECYDEIPSYEVDLLRPETVVDKARKAVAAGDFTIALLHTGTEYSFTPNQEQRDFLQMLLQQGVDLTICAGPHVLQGFDTLRDDSGNEMAVYYSLGNFISTQLDWECMLGGMADVTLTKDKDTKEWGIHCFDLVPLMTHYNHEAHEYYVCPLSEYTPELAARHELNVSGESPFTLDDLTSLYDDVLVNGI